MFHSVVLEAERMSISTDSNGGKDIVLGYYRHALFKEILKAYIASPAQYFRDSEVFFLSNRTAQIAAFVFALLLSVEGDKMYLEANNPLNKSFPRTLYSLAGSSDI